MFFEDIAVTHRHMHFVGIGGIGMSGLAEILLDLGYKVSGSDLRSTDITKRLESLGATVFQGHEAENIGAADAVVVSAAIQESNPERTAAVAARIPIIQRGELLAELMRLKYGIAITGSHGKTTTTSMAASILHSAGKDPTVVVGGRVDSIGSNARLGKSDLLLAEADESDGSFLRLAPILAVITTLDQEHLDHYGTYGALVDGFVNFANKVPFYGAVLLGIDDPQVRSILPRIHKPIRTYGTTPDADLVAGSITCGHDGSRFRLTYRGDDLGWFQVNSLGRHNASNAVAAVLVGLELGLEPDAIRTGLRSFTGVDRRFQTRGAAGGVTVIDDYGHHPTEIAATLAAAKTSAFERVLVVFQPHRYTRTAALMDEFACCFRECDRLFVVDIYSASEDPIEGVNSEELTRRIQATGQTAVQYVASMDAAIEAAAAAAQEGDAIVTLGAGNISQAGPRLLETLAAVQAKVRISNEGLR